ncbi:MAG: MFS transporter [Actinomycetota bacterium]
MRETASRRRRPWEGLSHNVHVLSGVSFFQDAASEMLYPVLPLFITGVLGAPPSVVGLIEGMAEGTASILKAVSGRLADRMRRKPLIAAGYGISSVSKLLIGLATAWPLVLAARVADRTGKGIRGAPRDALIADDTARADRGRAFGFHRAADTFGAVVGPLIGLALYYALDRRMRPLFFIAFIPAAISVSLIGFVHERPRTHEEKADAVAQRGTSLGKPYRRVVTFLTLFGLVNFTDALLLLRAKELGLGFAGVVLVYTLYNLTYSLLSYPAGGWSDRIPRRKVFALGVAVFAVAYFGLGIVTSATWVWLLLPVYGAYTALTDGVSRAWVADLAPEATGAALGTYAALSGAASIVAGVWAGLAWGGTGRLPLMISGSIAAVLAVALWVGGARLERDPDSGPANPIGPSR